MIRRLRSIFLILLMVYIVSNGCGGSGSGGSSGSGGGSGLGGGSGSGGGGNTSPIAPTITSISVVCDPTSLQVGQTSQCMAAVVGTGNYSSSINWITSIGSINSSGLFTASSTTGTVTVTATSVQDTVTDPVVLEAVNRPDEFM